MSNVFIVFSKNYIEEDLYHLDVEMVFDNARDAYEWANAQRFPMIYLIKEFPVCKITRKDYQHNFSI